MISLNLKQQIIIRYLDEFPILEDLRAFIVEKSAMGMKLRIHTLNPVNQYSYDHQYVSYFENMFMELPDDEIFCASNKVMLAYEGMCQVNVGNFFIFFLIP